LDNASDLCATRTAGFVLAAVHTGLRLELTFHAVRVAKVSEGRTAKRQGSGERVANGRDQYWSRLGLRQGDESIVLKQPVHTRQQAKLIGHECLEHILSRVRSRDRGIVGISPDGRQNDARASQWLARAAVGVQRC